MGKVPIERYGFNPALAIVVLARYVRWAGGKWLKFGWWINIFSGFECWDVLDVGIYLGDKIVVVRLAVFYGLTERAIHNLNPARPNLCMRV